MNPLLVLDLDDTLYPEHTFVRSGFVAVDRWVQTNWRVSGFQSIAVELFEGGLRSVIFDRALEHLGIEPTPETVHRLVRVYRAHRPNIALYGDARWLLEHFGPIVTLALLTDGYLVTQRNKVEALGIKDVFDTIVYTDEFGRACWKPSRVPYLKMMERTGRAGSDCIYVSDNPTKDFVAANALGWHTIRILRDDGIYQAVPYDAGHEAAKDIHSLFELTEVLPGLL